MATGSSARAMKILVRIYVVRWGLLGVIFSLSEMHGKMINPTISRILCILEQKNYLFEERTLG